MLPARHRDHHREAVRILPAFLRQVQQEEVERVSDSPPCHPEHRHIAAAEPEVLPEPQELPLRHAVHHQQEEHLQLVEFPLEEHLHRQELRPGHRGRHVRHRHRRHQGHLGRAGQRRPRPRCTACYPPQT